VSKASARTPRFRRCPKGTIALREVDHAILLAHGRWSLLSSKQAEMLVPTISKDRLRRHLFDLFHHGYLSRPDQTVSLVAGKGSRAMVHALGPLGHRALRRHYGLSPRRVAPDVGHGYLAHEIETRDALLKVQLLVESIPGLEFLLLDELREHLPPCPKGAKSDEWRVRVPFESGERTVLVKPDAVFAVRDRNAAAGRGLRFACVELDRGRMKIQTRNLSYGSSIAQKLICYAELHYQELDRARGLAPMKVAFVTTSAERVRNMVEACGALGDAGGAAEALRGQCTRLLHARP
jgi:hypothetical protein